MIFFDVSLSNFFLVPFTSKNSMLDNDSRLVLNNIFKDEK